jgi:kinetochore protein NNF1
METDETASQHQDNHTDDADDDAQPSASPPPQATAAPVVPGPRATRFQELYAQSLRRTLGKLKWDNFAACYPTVAKKAEPVLKQVQAQMAEKLGEKCEV